LRLRRVAGLLAEKGAERSRVVALYRRGRLTEAHLDDQLADIDQEEMALKAQLEEVQGKLAGAASISTTVSTAESLLMKLGARLDQPISWECKRQLIEALVGGVRVETIETEGKREAIVTVTYRFAGSVNVCRGMRADNNCYIERVYRQSAGRAA
jgi:hypothetical protein